MPDAIPSVKTTQITEASKIRQSALRAYWKFQAEQWWRSASRTPTPICDVCNAPLKPEDSYYFVVTRRMKCHSCTERSLQDWDGSQNWFGHGELSNALAYYDPSGEIQAQARRLALIKPDQESLIASLIGDLSDGDENVRKSAIEDLVRIDTSAVGPLITALMSENYRVRRSAATALGQIKDTRAVEPLIAALKDRETRFDTVEVVTALAKIGDMRAVIPLLDTLEDENDPKRQAAISALGNLGTPVIEPLINAFKDPRERVRSGVAWTLGQFNDARVVEPLINALKDERWEVRMSAAAVLSKVGDVRAIDHLIFTLNDAHEYVRGRSANALGEITSQMEDAMLRTRVVELLIVALKDTYFGVRLSAAEAIGKIGDIQATEPLEALLNDESRSVRDAATKALIRILG